MRWMGGCRLQKAEPAVGTHVPWPLSSQLCVTATRNQDLSPQGSRCWKQDQSAPEMQPLLSPRTGDLQISAWRWFCSLNPPGVISQGLLLVEDPRLTTCFPTENTTSLCACSKTPQKERRHLSKHPSWVLPLLLRSPPCLSMQALPCRLLHRVLEVSPPPEPFPQHLACTRVALAFLSCADRP